MLQNIFQFLESPLTVPVAIALAIGFLLGFLIAKLGSQKTAESLRVRNAELQTLLQADQQHFEQQLSLLQDAREHLAQEFAQLSQRALKQNNGLFLRLAEQSQKMQTARSKADLENRQQAIEHLLQPMRETLAQTQDKLTELEKNREHAFGSLQQQLKQLAGSESELRLETRNLVNALKRPDVRGRWGEISLKRLAELAGMVEHCDFYEQVSANENAAVRPDMVVKLPGNREIIVDAKTPLDAYLTAIDSDDAESEKAALKRHAQQMRKRVSELSAKSYWQQFSNTPDFVIMFVPGDQFLVAALQNDPALLEQAMQQHIIITTPSSLVALLRAVEFGWRQSRFNDNAEDIRKLGESLQQRLGTFIDHLSQTGKALESSINHYNKAIGSLNRNVVPTSQKMSQMGISELRTKATPSTIDSSVRSPIEPS